MEVFAGKKTFLKIFPLAGPETLHLWEGNVALCLEKNLEEA